MMWRKALLPTAWLGAPCEPDPLLLVDNEVDERDKVVEQPLVPMHSYSTASVSTGNLMVIIKGSSNNLGGLVCHSGIDLTLADYYTKLQGD
jgi:hypothetical protein